MLPSWKVTFVFLVLVPLKKKKSGNSQRKMPARRIGSLKDEYILNGLARVLLRALMSACVLTIVLQDSYSLSVF